MPKRRSKGASEGLRALQVDFERWRAQRQRGARIPERLWESAVERAREHGVNHAARSLGLDDYGLKKRVEAAEEKESADGSEAAVEFVEIGWRPPQGERGCVLELEERGGRKLRMELPGWRAGELERLARSLWEGAR